MDYTDLFINGYLPDAFTDKENEEYFSKVQNGDIRAKDKIKEHNLRLVMNIVNKKFYNVDGFDKTELFSIGTFALNKAVDTFNLDKGVKFSTYAGRVIENQIRMALRKVKYSKNDISLESMVYDGKDGDELTLGNMIASGDNLEENYLNEELLKGVRKSLDILTEIEREVIELGYGFRGNLYKQREIAEILGISRSYVSRIELNATKKISEYLIRQGLIEGSSKRLEKSPTSESVALMYAREIVNNVTLEELSLKTGKSIKSIKYLIARKLPLINNDLYMEVKRIFSINSKQEIMDIESGIETNKKLLSIFSNYSEEEIYKALEKLETREKEMLLLRYPLKIENPKSLSFIAQKYDIKPGSANAKIKSIIKKVGQILDGKYIDKADYIFEYFKEYPKEQVLQAISTLPEEGRKIIELKYGLNGNPVTSNKDLSKLCKIQVNNMSARIYSIRKGIQTRLEKMDKKQQNEVKIVEEKVVTVITEPQNIVNSNFEDCRSQVRISINMLSDTTEQVILLLRLGYVRNKYYTESEISKFLDIPVDEVKIIIERALSNLSLLSVNTTNRLNSNEKVFELK